MGKKRKIGIKPKTVKINLPLIIWGLIGLLSVAIVVCMLLPEEKIEFVFAQNAGCWQVAPGTKAELTVDQVRLTKSLGDMYVVIPAINIDADWYDVAVIEQEAPVAYDTGDLLFTSPYNKNFDFGFRFDYDTGLAARMHKRFIYLGSHGAWQGRISNILIMPAVGSKQALLKSITFIHANPWTKAKAVWSNFTRYYDPKLGSCFAMASPLFIKTGFSSYFTPFLWGFLVTCLLIVAVVSLFKLDERIKKYTIVMLFVIFLLIWGLLDARNNVYYLKGIGRDISLYWGKTLDEKRGIVTGDLEFAEFMKYCDENIPLDARTFNLISRSPRGTAQNYLSSIQYRFQLRPRLNGVYQFLKNFPKSYYIVYQTNPAELKGVDHDGWVVSGYLGLSKNETLRQKVLLWNRLEDLNGIRLKFEPGASLAENDLAIEVLDESGEKILATGKLTQIVTFESAVAKTFSEPLFKIHVLAPYEKSWVILQIKNNREKTINIGYSKVQNPYTHGAVQSKNEGLFYKGKRIKGELALTTEYWIKNPTLFKKYSENSYIFTK